MLLSLTLPDTSQRYVLLQVTVLAEVVQGLKRQHVGRRIDVCGARELSKRSILKIYIPLCCHIIIT